MQACLSIAIFTFVPVNLARRPDLPATLQAIRTAAEARQNVANDTLCGLDLLQGLGLENTPDEAAAHLYQICLESDEDMDFCKDAFTGLADSSDQMGTDSIFCQKL